MAIIGEIIVIIIGLIVLIGGSFTAYASAAFSGKGGWLVFAFAAAGLAILWAAGHYGPITLVLGE